MSKSEAGKGDDRRPMFITKEEWDRRYQKTFGQEKDEQKEKDSAKIQDQGSIRSS